jgi:hypothetical protein
MPFDLRDKVAEAAARDGRSFNAEVLHRLEESFERRAPAGGRGALFHRMLIPSSGERGMQRNKLRLAFGVMVVCAAAAVAAIAGSSHLGSSGSVQLNKLHSDPDALGMGNQFATIGVANEERSPEASAAAEDYRNRAYPGDTIPFAWTQAAGQAWNAFAKKTAKKNDKNTWTLIGPSQAQYPGVLNRSGAQYNASGRTTGLLAAPTCKPNFCRLWLAAAGGGIWRTDKALSNTPHWEFISGSFPTNAIGTIYADPNDASGNTIYVGTGESHASADSEAGFGVMKTTDGGDTWKEIANNTPFLDRAISTIRVVPRSPNTMYVATTRGVRGVSSVSGGAVSLKPGAAAWGLWKTTDGGQTWTYLFDAGEDPGQCSAFSPAGQNPCSIRGVNDVELDPRNSNTIYAAAYGRGIFRSDDAGLTWRQIFTPLVPQNVAPPTGTCNPSQPPPFCSTTDRTMFAVTQLPNGNVRIYAADGDVGPDGGEPGLYSRVWRTDDADTAQAAGNAGWKSLTSDQRGNPYYGTYDYCWAQCWYDNDIVTPKGQPDTVYVQGAYQYGEAGNLSNGRGVVVSYTAGEPNPAFKGGSWADLTRDATPSDQPDGIHPDQHSFAFNPENPDQWWDGSDGGIVRNDGKYVDDSDECDERTIVIEDPADPTKTKTVPLPQDPASYLTCRQLLSHVPHDIEDDLNKDLSTLQFQSVSVSLQKPLHLVQGGTQDNGTFEWNSQGSGLWWQIMYGDGGQSGFDATDDSIRFNEFTGRATDSNFHGGQPKWWVVTSGPLYQTTESAPFYSAITQDPVVHAQRFIGLKHIWRTQKNGGDQAFLEANCPEFTTAASQPECGDWVALGGPKNVATDDPTVPNPGDLTSSFYGGTRTGGNVIAIERTRGNTSTLWAATTTGRVFVSSNASDPNALAVTFTRCDDKATNDPARFVSSIHPDPANPNRAWLSYSGYNASTPAQQGHVFEVTCDPVAGTATWRDLGVEAGNGDYPITDLVRDDVTGNLYAATDFGVLLGTASGANYVWSATTGLPRVEVPGLTIVPEARVIYAATHGRSVWRMLLN